MNIHETVMTGQFAAKYFTKWVLNEIKIRCKVRIQIYAYLKKKVKTDKISIKVYIKLRQTENMHL